MTDAEILTKVKSALGITGDFQDNTLQVYIADVKGFMLDAGVDSAVVNSAAAVGCIARGVADLWNYGAGSAKLSSYFTQRMLQLAASLSNNDGDSSTVERFTISISSLDTETPTTTASASDILANMGNLEITAPFLFGSQITIPESDHAEDENTAVIDFNYVNAEFRVVSTITITVDKSNESVSVSVASVDLAE